MRTDERLIYKLPVSDEIRCQGVKTLATIAFLAMLFPYFHPFTFIVRSDTQPWAAFVAALTAAFSLAFMPRSRLSMPLVLLSAVAGFSLLYLVVRGDTEFGFRSIFGYVSVPLLAYVAYKSYRYVWPYALPAAVVVWLLVGVIQSAWNRSFGADLLPRLTTDSMRGITGLSPEPSFLGVMGLMMLVLNELAFAHGRYRVHVYYAVMFALVLLALASSSGVGLILVVGFLIVRTVLVFYMQPQTRHAFADVASVSLITWALFLGLDNSNPLSDSLTAAAEPTRAPTTAPSPAPIATPTPDLPTVTPVTQVSSTAPSSGSPAPTATAAAQPSLTPLPADAPTVPTGPTAQPTEVPTADPGTSVPFSTPTVPPTQTPTHAPLPSPTPLATLAPTATVVPSPTPTVSVPETLSGQRSRNLLQRFFDDPAGIFEGDASLGERTAHIVLSGMSLWESKGVGYGPGTWNDHALELRDSAPDWVQRMTVRKFDLGGRVMSGWGTALFELGVVGLVFIGTILFIMGKSVTGSRKLAPAALLSAVLVGATMVGSVPLALPAFGYIVGIHLWIAYGDHGKVPRGSEQEAESTG